MCTLAVVLFAVIDAESWPVDEIRAWADRQIVEAESVPAWLAGLSLAVSLEQAAASLREELGRRGVLPEAYPSLLIGLTYLRFRNGARSKDQLVRHVGDIVDAYGGWHMDVEAWYERTAAPNLPPEIETVLESLAAQAEALLAQLKSTRRATDEGFWRDTVA